MSIEAPTISPSTKIVLLCDFFSEGVVLALSDKLWRAGYSETEVSSGYLSAFALHVLREDEAIDAAPTVAIVSSPEGDLENLYLLGSLNARLLTGNVRFYTDNGDLLAMPLLSDIMRPASKMHELATSPLS